MGFNSRILGLALKVHLPQVLRCQYFKQLILSNECFFVKNQLFYGQLLRHNLSHEKLFLCLEGFTNSCPTAYN